MRCHALLQGIFPTQQLNSHLLHWQVGSLPLSHPGSSYFKNKQISRVWGLVCLPPPRGPTHLWDCLSHVEEHQDHLIHVGLGRHLEHLPDGLLGRGVRGAGHVVVNMLDDLRHLWGVGGCGVPASWVLDTRSAGASDPGIINYTSIKLNE